MLGPILGLFLLCECSNFVSDTCWGHMHRLQLGIVVIFSRKLPPAAMLLIEKAELKTCHSEHARKLRVKSCRTDLVIFFSKASLQNVCNEISDLWIQYMEFYSNLQFQAAWPCYSSRHTRKFTDELTSHLYILGPRCDPLLVSQCLRSRETEAQRTQLSICRRRTASRWLPLKAVEQFSPPYKSQPKCFTHQVKLCRARI